MREPAFWWQTPGAISAMLLPLAMAYDSVATRRMGKPAARVAAPVICIGDPTVGGAGKTPTAIAIVRMLAAAGRRPAFLTRGYGGSLAGPVIVAPHHEAAEVGDEPLLLARAATTVVGRDRAAGAAVALAQGADILILDDGFQSPSVHKDFSLLVVDGHRGIGNGCTVPAGPLRAGLKAQIDRAQAMVVVGAPSRFADLAAAAAQRHGLPVWTGRLVPDAAALAALAGRPVLAFAGIGHPRKFFATLETAGIAVAQAVTFPDHHAYTAAEANDLVRRAEQAGLTLVTTEKDFVRLGGAAERADLARRTATVPVTLVFDDTAAVKSALAALTPPA
jgi:tetraacyldisaccharide 4'-kinase